MLFNLDGSFTTAKLTVKTLALTGVTIDKGFKLINYGSTRTLKSVDWTDVKFSGSCKVIKAVLFDL